MALSLDDLAAGVIAGDRSALARALSLAERDFALATELLSRLKSRSSRAHVIGVTGPPGAGKSTLVGVLLRQFVQMGQRVAVLAVDPSSPVTGGALLGDRFRIGEGVVEERSFIRSTATRGSLGGLTGAARQMIELMDAAGYDLVMVETVGTGQSEVDVAKLADSTLVVFPPGLGDELQAIKAGILELADILVVTKSDVAGATQARQSLLTVAPLWRSAPPIYSVSALSGEGIVELAEAVMSRARMPRESATVATPPPQMSLSARFDRLRAELERRLPFDWVDNLSLHQRQVQPGRNDATLGVECALRPGGDAFQLGAVAAGLLLLAAEMHLDCVVEELDAARGRINLVFRHAS